MPVTFYSQCVCVQMYKIKGIIVIGPYVSCARISLNHICNIYILCYNVLICKHQVRRFTDELFQNAQMDQFCNFTHVGQFFY